MYILFIIFFIFKTHSININESGSGGNETKAKFIYKLYPLGVVSINGDKLPNNINFDGEICFGFNSSYKYCPNKNTSTSNASGFYKSKEIDDGIVGNINNNGIPANNEIQNYYSNNDVLFEEVPSTSKKGIFSIKFDINSLKYTITDLLSPEPIFQIVKNETVLKNNSLVNIGDSYIHISLGEDSNSDKSGRNNGNNINSELINLKIYDKSSQLIHDPM